MCKMIKSKANTSFITQPNYQNICYFKIDRSKKIYTININTYKLFILKSTKINDRSKIMISPLIYFVLFMTCT